MSNDASDQPDVFIESREPDQIKTTLFPSVLMKILDDGGYTYRVVYLEYGDYILPYQKVVIERKTVGDFIESWHGDQTGKERLYSQIGGCIDHYGDSADRIIVLLEDGLRVIPDAVNKCLWYLPPPDEKYPDPVRIKESAKGYVYGQIYYLRRYKIHPNAWMGTINAIQRWKFGEKKTPVNVLMAWDTDHAVQLVIKLLQGEKKKPIRPTRMGHRHKTIPDAQRYVLEGLPGVSGTFSDRILAKYETPIAALNNLATKDIKELGVKRFKKDNLKAIQTILNTKYDPPSKDE